MYARAASKIELYDRWAAERGWLDEAGNSPPFAKEYYVSLNAAGRLLSKLEEHLRRHQQAGPSPLELHLHQNYAADDAEFTEVESG